MTDAENRSSWIDSLDFEGAKAVLREVELDRPADLDEMDIAVERSIIGRITQPQRTAKPRRAAFVGSVSMSFVVVLAFLITFGVGWVGSYYWYQRAMEAEVQAKYAQYDQMYVNHWFELSKRLSARQFDDDTKQREYINLVIKVISESRDEIEAAKAKLGDDRDNR